MKRSRAERSFHLGSDGGVSGPAESRDQLRYAVSIDWHTSHVDVVPQRHGERVSPARTIKTRAGGQRSRPSGVGLRVGRLHVVVPGRRMVTEARPLRPSRFGSPLAEAFNRLGGRAPFRGPSRKGLRSPLSPLPPEAERLPTDPHRWAAATTRHGERSRAGCAGERMDAPVIGWSNGSTNAGAPGWASPSDLSHAGSRLSAATVRPPGGRARPREAARAPLRVGWRRLGFGGRGRRWSRSRRWMSAESEAEKTRAEAEEEESPPDE